MRRIANGTQVAALPPPAAAIGAPGYASNGDPVGGVPATIWDADTANMLIEELMAFLPEAGIASDGNNRTQVLAACRALFGGVGSLAGNGYMRLPGGVILQWGQGTSGPIAVAIVYPVAFPTVTRSIVVTENESAGWSSPPAPTFYGTGGADRFGFQCRCVRLPTGGTAAYQAGNTFNWIAIGH